MRRISIVVAALVCFVAAGAYAANQVATDAFRKILAAELFSANSAIGVAGNPFVTALAPPAAQLRGSASATTTGATEIIAAQGSGVKIYVSSMQCGRDDAGTSPITVTFNDTVSTVLVIPNAGNGDGSNPVFPVPLQVAANTHLTFTASSGVTTLYCNAQGYSGS